MTYLCSVCGCSFKRLQDCASHIKLKKDEPHRCYIEAQSIKLMTSFANAIKTSAVAATAISSNHPPILEAPSVQLNDVDNDNLPSSSAMVINTDDNDDSVSVMSSPAELVKDSKDEIKEKVLMEVLQELFGGLEVDEVFNFLSCPDLDDNIPDLIQPSIQHSIGNAFEIIMFHNLSEPHDRSKKA